MIEKLNTDRWYVDIHGQIRMQTAWQIIEGLLSQELKVIYRVSRDRQNWKAICNQDYFEQAVGDLIQHLSKEVTKYGEKGATQNLKDELSGFHNIKNLTTGISEQLEHANQLQEINVHLNALRSLAAEIINKKKLVIDMSKTKVIEEVHEEDRNEYINAPTAWEQLKARFFAGEKKILSKVIAATVVLLVALVGTLKYYDYKERQEIKIASAQAQAALQAKIAGDYAKAVSLFSGVQNINALDPATLIQMAEAHTQTKSYANASELLKIAITKPGSKSEQAHAYSMMGLISQQQNQPQAAMSYYEESIKEMPIFDALYNLAVIHLDNRKPELSEPLLLKALALKHPESAIAFLTLFETAILLDKNAATLDKSKPAQWLRVKNLLPTYDTLMIPGQPYYEEVLATRLILAATLGDQDTFYKLLPTWLDLDPKAPTNKPYSPAITYHRVAWPQIVRWCQDVYKDTSLNNLKGAFYAGCVARARELKDALPYAQYAYMNTENKDAALRGLLAYLVWSTDNAVGTKQVLREGDTTGSKLAEKTLSEVCTKYPDADCPKK